MPCQPFRLPPPVQPKFIVAYSARDIQCTPKGCTTSASSGKIIQSLVEHRKRGNVYIRDHSSSTFILPGNESGYTEVNEVPFCSAFNSCSVEENVFFFSCSEFNSATLCSIEWYHCYVIAYILVLNCGWFVRTACPSFILSDFLFALRNRINTFFHKPTK